MNLVRCTAAGRLVRIGPHLLLLSPPSLRGFATLLAFLKDRVEPPEEMQPWWLPDMASGRALAEYSTAAGSTLLLYVTTRRDHPDMTMDQVARIIADSPPDEAATSALIRAAFVRQEGGGTIRPRGARPIEDGGGRRGIESVDFAPVFEGENLRRFTPMELSEMSMDQFENALFAGKLEREDKLSIEEVMEIYEAHRPKKGGEADPCPSRSTA